jgi:hypothetical protein
MALGRVPPLATGSVHGRCLDAGGWCRRIADLSDRGLGRVNWADSEPKRAASGRTGGQAKAAAPLRERKASPKRKTSPCIKAAFDRIATAHYSGIPRCLVLLPKTGKLTPKDSRVRGTRPIAMRQHRSLIGGWSARSKRIPDERPFRGVSMNEPRDLNARDQRSRRNILKIGAILTSATAANLTATRGARALHPPMPIPVPHCLLRGTMIRTTDGERKIEDLAIGDLLPTVFGGVRPIQWIGHYPIKKSDRSRPWATAALPVRIARSALAPNVPHTDLYVTVRHALLIDGVLIPAEDLINGVTITIDDAAASDELHFFHIKMKRHTAIYAEGAPVETLVEVDDAVVNFADYFRRYGAPTPGQDCAPRVSYGGRRGQLKSRMRSAISPWFDRREQIDIIRDRLEERAVALTR